MRDYCENLLDKAIVMYDTASNCLTSAYKEYKIKYYIFEL